MAFDRDKFLKLIRGETRGLWPALGRFALRLLALPYGFAIRVRNRAFDLGFRKSQRAAMPVISVGNLTVGGTGKTPVVEWLATELTNRGSKVCLLSRGYKALPGADGNSLAPTSTLNDEGLVLRQNLPNVPHLQGADRVANAGRAVREFGVDVLILDDGFQHRQLHRDVDIVLIDATDPFGGGRLLPAGLLREPIAGLRRADCILITRADQITADCAIGLAVRDFETPPSGRISAAEKERTTPVLSVRFGPKHLVAADGATAPLETLAGKRIALVSGIGNPAGFERTVAALGGQIVAHRIFPDHFHYGPEAETELDQWSKTIMPELVVTTQKDLVKFRNPKVGEANLWALKIGVDFLDSSAHFLASIAGKLRPVGQGLQDNPG